VTLNSVLCHSLSLFWGEIDTVVEYCLVKFYCSFAATEAVKRSRKMVILGKEVTVRKFFFFILLVAPPSNSAPILLPFFFFFLDQALHQGVLL